MTVRSCWVYGGIGEGTIAIAATLARATLTGKETYADVRKLARPEVLYLIFEGQGIRQRVPGSLTQDVIDQHAKAAYETWGGDARLASCATVLVRP